MKRERLKRERKRKEKKKDFFCTPIKKLNKYKQGKNTVNKKVGTAPEKIWRLVLIPSSITKK